MALKTDHELLQHTHNTSRFFVEHPQLAWATLIGVIVWGVYGFFHMPQRKDPDIPVRTGVATCLWPGATAEQVEQLVARPIEDAIAENKTIHPGTAADYGIRSVSFAGRAVVYVQLAENVKNTAEQLNDINLRLQALKPKLPQGASAVQFQSNFGDTSALMLTVASPSADAIEIEIRASEMEKALRAERQSISTATLHRTAILFAYPLALSQASALEVAHRLQREAEAKGWLRQTKLIWGNGFVGIDGSTNRSDMQVSALLSAFIQDTLPASSLDPDLWPPISVHDPGMIMQSLNSVAGSKYTYAQMDDFTNLITRSLQGVEQTSRVDRSGVLPQQVYLEYSQQKLASYGLEPADLSKILSGHNITAPGGTLEANGSNVIVRPSGLFPNASAIGDLIVTRTAGGVPVYLRDLVRISSGYQAPAPLLNFFTWRDATGQWHRSRAVTVAVFMRNGEQIQKFGKAIDSKLGKVRARLPADLIMDRTSDQPLQVRENIDLFMDALYEAIGLVILVALIGFWEWRSALIMALSIPITLAMTFGVLDVLGIDLQQVSIATLIIALGLLVDDPVVANDAIKRELAGGLNALDAAWIGPTKLARAIVFATATNIIAYLPFLMLTGNTGFFLYSLPIVMTASLVCSRVVSMTFIPLLGRYLLRARARPELTLEEKRTTGFYGFYNRLAGQAIRHRWVVLCISLAFLGIGAAMCLGLKTQFFPDDLQYYSYVDIWMPNSTPIAGTNQITIRAEDVIQRTAAAYDLKQGGNRSGAGTPKNLLTSLVSFVGGGSPRFWFSVAPQAQQSNYSQIILHVNRKEATPQLVRLVQGALNEEIAGAQITVHQLQTNPVEFPVEVRVVSTFDVDPKDEAEDNVQLRNLASRVTSILRDTPGVAVTQDDWFGASPQLGLSIDADRANLAGVSNRDIANSTTLATDGVEVGVLQQENKNIPIVARQQPDQRASLSDVGSFYISPSNSSQKVPIQAFSSSHIALTTQRIRRQDHFRTIGVHCYPQPNVLPSQILKQAMPALERLKSTLPPGYSLIVGGEVAKQKQGFGNLATVLLISALGIYIALLFQFNNAIKPLLVFAATPFGAVGALLALVIMGAPFGFMAFLGIASLVGVIISHVIVLFDFIEELHERGEPLEQALRDAGIERLRPVLITVAATIFALFPLALHGGPLWKPLCYAQIGGLAVATFITLLLVPALYTIAVKDLRIIGWKSVEALIPQTEVVHAD